MARRRGRPSRARGSGCPRRPRSTVSGTPISLLNDPGGATGGPTAREHLREQVLGAGLARRPGDADDATRQPSRSSDAHGRAGPSARTGSSHDDRGTPTGRSRQRQRPHRPVDGGGGEVVPVDVLARHGDEQPAGPRRRASRRPPARSPSSRRPAPRRGARRSPRRPRASVSGITAVRPSSTLRAAAPRAARSGRRTGARRPRPPGPARVPCPRRRPCRRAGRRVDGRADRGACGRRPRGPRPARRPGRCCAPARTAARIAAGSSERGLSSVTTTTSASRAAAAPMSGRLSGSRSPPAPSTTTSRPDVDGAQRPQHGLDRVGGVRVVDERQRTRWPAPAPAPSVRARRGRRRHRGRRRPLDAGLDQHDDGQRALATLKSPGTGEVTASRRPSRCLHDDPRGPAGPAVREVDPPVGFVADGSTRVVTGTGARALRPAAGRVVVDDDDAPP